jgi:RNA polymerase-binding transcription factor DksA
MIDEQFIQEQKGELEKLQKNLSQTIEENKKFVDLGQSDDEQTMEAEALENTQAMLKSAEDEIREVKKALERIENGSYGKCVICGEIIERGRLKAYPAADKCVAHAS